MKRLPIALLLLIALAISATAQTVQPSAGTGQVVPATATVSGKAKLGQLAITTTAGLSAITCAAGNKGQVVYVTDVAIGPYTCDGAGTWNIISGGSISGLTANRVAYATGATTVGGDAGFTWDTSTLLLAKSGSYPLLRIRNTAGGAGYWDIGPQYVNNFGISGNGGSPAFTIDTGNFVGIGTNLPLAKLHVGPGTNLFVTTNILSNAVLANTIVQSGHAFGDVAAIDRDGGIGYASYDTNVTYSGTFNYDHWVGYQTNLQYGSSGTLTNGYGYYFGPHINAGTVTNLYGAYYVNPTGAGAVGNNYAIYIENQTKGGTSNQAIYSAGGASYLLAGTASVVPLTVKGATSQSGNLQSWQDSSGAQAAAMSPGGMFLLGTGNSASDRAIYIKNPAWSTATELYGIMNVWTAPSTATVGVYGYYSTMKSTATAYTLGSLYDMWLASPTIGAGSAVTNSYGLRIDNHGASGVTNAYGLYIGAQSGAATLNYAIYSAGGTWATDGALKFITDNTYDIGAVSSNRPASIYAGSGLYSGGNIEASSGGALTIKSRFRIYSNADGTAVLYNNATTDFTRLQFGGASTKFAAITPVNDGTNAQGLIIQRADGTPQVFANLGSATNGSMIYCSDCTIANPCASGGTGAIAKRLNGAWVCN